MAMQKIAQHWGGFSLSGIPSFFLVLPNRFTYNGLAAQHGTTWYMHVYWMYPLVLTNIAMENHHAINR